MERQLLVALYQWLVSLNLPRRARARFPDLWIILTYLWAVLCDRPVHWACQPVNWPVDFAWFTPPKDSTMSRRLKTESVQSLLNVALQKLNPPPPPGSHHWVDGKPLTVGGATRDPDARAGRGAGMMAKGYKLHALYAIDGTLEDWDVQPLNVSEPKVALNLIAVLRGPGYLMGDHVFDWRLLYDGAGERGVQLVVSPDRHGTGTPGRRRQSQHRVIGLKIAQSPLGKSLLRQRFGIDRLFGQMGNIFFGLGPLPNWVRRLPRVRRWVHGKLIWFSFYRQLKNQRLRC